MNHPIALRSRYFRGNCAMSTRNEGSVVRMPVLHGPGRMQTIALRHFVEGRSFAEIAKLMTLSEPGVILVLESARRKLGTETVAEAAIRLKNLETLN